MGRMLPAVSYHIASLPYLLQVVGRDTVVCFILLGKSLPSNKKADTPELSLDPVFSKNFVVQTGKMPKLPFLGIHGRVIITGEEKETKVLQTQATTLL